MGSSLLCCHGQLPRFARRREPIRKRFEFGAILCFDGQPQRLYFFMCPAFIIEFGGSG